MKLDVNVLRYLGKDDFRTLTAVEMGQKNVRCIQSSVHDVDGILHTFFLLQHEIVPSQLVESIAGLKHGGAFKCLKTLLRHKLVHHEGKKYDGYRLTSLGYDFLAIRALTARGSIAGVGRQIGVGKESDVYEVVDDEGRTMALKLHRLGRTSFRAVKSKRDYVKRGNHFSWLYLSRLAALKEFAFMKALGENGLPVPEAIECNRHAVLMSLVEAHPMVQVREFANTEKVYRECMSMLVKLAQLGLVHCDFNEFNLLIDDDENLTLIDFPQMVSTSHANAEELFDRDVDGVVKFFERKFPSPDDAERAINECYPNLSGVLTGKASVAAETIDKQLRASGFKNEYQVTLQGFYNQESDGDENDDSLNSTESSELEETESEDDTDYDDDEEENIEDKAAAAGGGGGGSLDKEMGAKMKISDVILTFDTDTAEENQEEGNISDEDRREMQQRAIAKKVVDQRKADARRQFVVKASRNAMKSKNVGKRKGQASGNKPMSSSDFGW